MDKKFFDFSTFNIQILKVIDIQHFSYLLFLTNFVNFIKIRLILHINLKYIDYVNHCRTRKEDNY